MVDKKTKIVLITAIIIVVALFIGNEIYKENDYLSLVLVCDYNSKYTNYEETLEFSFVDDILYEYQRYEMMKETESTSIKDIKKLFNDQRDKVKDNIGDYFNYEIIEHDNYVEVKTYIKTLFNEEFYNSYIKEKGITMSSSLDEVRKTLSEDYSCYTEKRG